MNLKFMKKAIQEAQLSQKDIPVGAVIVKNDKVIAFAHNEKEKNNDVTAHAEILAIRDAEKSLNNWRLNGCDLYVTLEPCTMCMSAILQSRISNLYFGSYDTVYGALSVFPQILEIYKSSVKINGGIMEDECTEILADYFKRLREQ